MKSMNKVLIAGVICGITTIANAATMTIDNNSGCSSKTTYETFDNTHKMIEKGMVDANASKKINLNGPDDKSNVQVVIVKDVMTNGKKQTTEYLLAKRKICTISDKKSCYDFPHDMINSTTGDFVGMQMLCNTSLKSAPPQTSGSNAAITVGGTPLTPTSTH